MTKPLHRAKFDNFQQQIMYLPMAAQLMMAAMLHQHDIVSKSCISHNCFFIIVFLCSPKFFGPQLHNFTSSQYCHTFYNMANQDSPLWERLGMDHDLSPPWTSLNITKAIKSWLFTQPPVQCTIEENIAH